MSTSTYILIVVHQWGLGLAEGDNFPQRVANQGSNLGLEKFKYP